MIGKKSRTSFAGPLLMVSPTLIISSEAKIAELAAEIVLLYDPKFIAMSSSMDYLKGKFTGNHRFSHDIWDVPVIFPLNQPIVISST